MRPSQLDCIKEELLAKYGSLETPDFQFQNHVFTERSYRECVDELLTHFFLNDSTNINQDGSFVYQIGEQNGPRWIAQFSMVGRYAVVVRLGKRGGALIVANGRDLTEKEIVILRILQRHKIVLLDEQTLLKPSGMKQNAADRAAGRIYHALFSDTDVLPWQVARASG